MLHAAAIFASAFLIFLVQPMVGKRILPWFGGVPAVWTLCLAFYQTALFLGYAYAHCSIRFLKPRAQLAVHGLAVAAAFASLPVLPETPPDGQLLDANPTMAVLQLLAGNVALPFLVLASTSPLVQAWFARAHPSLSPYPLYAVSNLGSFLALFVFPFVLEPHLALSETGRLWTWGFVATGLAVLACAVSASATRAADGAVAGAAAGAPGGGATDAGAGSAAGGEVAGAANGAGGHFRSLLWLGLSGSAVVLLTGVTNKLCLDVASIPFLWIVPLAIYLLTFVLCFSSERIYRRGLFVILALAAFALTRTIDPREFIGHQILAYCALLASVCMCLHGELYRVRPAASGLTGFYLIVSLGGALGGLIVGIVAPLVFDDYYELPLGLLLAAVTMLAVCARDPGSSLRWDGLRGRWRFVAPAALAAVVAFVASELRTDPHILHKERSFFGVLTIHELDDESSIRRSLTNGTTVHGLQFLGRTARRLPTSYYGRATGLGLALTSRPARSGGSKFGVIGLGVGTLAAYGRAGDTMRFYEIDPVVIELAGKGGYFSFLEDSKADVEVVLGDARRSMEDEQRRTGPQAYDVLVLDAFSSDAIPVHLMTREAFEIYFRALAPDGLMAVHVSNRHFQLMNLVSRAVDALGAHSLQVKTRPAPTLQSGLTDWVLVTRDPDQLTRLQIRMESRHRALELPLQSLLVRRGKEANLEAFPLWTDDYSDLLSVMRWR
ncbi:MAG: fused MFS/spermidine synthase [Myxococcota bacterium]